MRFSQWRLLRNSITFSDFQFSLTLWLSLRLCETENFWNKRNFIEKYQWHSDLFHPINHFEETIRELNRISTCAVYMHNWPKQIRNVLVPISRNICKIHKPKRINMIYFKMGETIRQSRWISNYKFILSLNRPKSGFGIYIFRPTAPFASPFMSLLTNQKLLPRWPTDSHLLNTLWTHERSQTRTNLLHLHRFHGRNIHKRIWMNLNT